MALLVKCIQAMEDNNDLLEYGNYLYTDSGSGMEIEQENCTSTQLIEIPIDDNCYKKNGELIIASFLKAHKIISSSCLKG